MYEVVLTARAERQLKKLEKYVQERIIAVLERTSVRPEAHYERLVGGSEYKLRVGDYRVIAEISLIEKKIFIFKIGHRKNVYDMPI